MILHLITERGRHLKVNDRNEIIQTDIPGFEPSGQWIFQGLVKRLNNGPFGYSAEWTKTAIINHTLPPLTYKNGRPKFLIADIDHGTYRHQGDGVVKAYITY